MKTTTSNEEIKATKAELCAALRRFINQRSGIEFANYQSGDWKASRESFMGDYRPILKHGKQARQLLTVVEALDGITAKDLIEATRAYSGRLQFAQRDDGVTCDYCTGQYFPTEYRNAACAVLALALHHYYGRQLPKPDGKLRRVIGQGTFRQEIDFDNYDGVTAGEAIRRRAYQDFGRAITKTWFN